MDGTVFVESLGAGVEESIEGYLADASGNHVAAAVTGAVRPHRHSGDH